MDYYYALLKSYSLLRKRQFKLSIHEQEERKGEADAKAAFQNAEPERDDTKYEDSGKKGGGPLYIYKNKEQKTSLMGGPFGKPPGAANSWEELDPKAQDILISWFAKGKKTGDIPDPQDAAPSPEAEEEPGAEAGAEAEEEPGAEAGAEEEPGAEGEEAPGEAPAEVPPPESPEDLEASPEADEADLDGDGRISGEEYAAYLDAQMAEEQQAEIDEKVEAIKILTNEIDVFMDPEEGGEEIQILVDNLNRFRETQGPNKTHEEVMESLEGFRATCEALHDMQHNPSRVTPERLNNLIGEHGLIQIEGGNVIIGGLVWSTTVADLPDVPATDEGGVEMCFLPALLGRGSDLPTEQQAECGETKPTQPAISKAIQSLTDSQRKSNEEAGMAADADEVPDGPTTREQAKLFEEIRSGKVDAVRGSGAEAAAEAGVSISILFGEDSTPEQKESARKKLVSQLEEAISTGSVDPQQLLGSFLVGTDLATGSGGLIANAEDVRAAAFVQFAITQLCGTEKLTGAAATAELERQQDAERKACEARVLNEFKTMSARYKAALATPGTADEEMIELELRAIMFTMTANRHQETEFFGDIGEDLVKVDAVGVSDPITGERGSDPGSKADMKDIFCEGGEGPTNEAAEATPTTGIRDKVKERVRRMLSQEQRDSYEKMCGDIGGIEAALDSLVRPVKKETRSFPRLDDNGNKIALTMDGVPQTDPLTGEALFEQEDKEVYVPCEDGEDCNCVQMDRELKTLVDLNKGKHKTGQLSLNRMASFYSTDPNPVPPYRLAVEAAIRKQKGEEEEAEQEQEEDEEEQIEKTDLTEFGGRFKQTTTDRMKACFGDDVIENGEKAQKEIQELEQAITDELTPPANWKELSEKERKKWRTKATQRINKWLGEVDGCPSITTDPLLPSMFAGTEMSEEQQAEFDEEFGLKSQGSWTDSDGKEISGKKNMKDCTSRMKRANAMRQCIELDDPTDVYQKEEDGTLKLSRGKPVPKPAEPPAKTTMAEARDYILGKVKSGVFASFFRGGEGSAKMEGRGKKKKPFIPDSLEQRGGGSHVVTTQKKIDWIIGSIMFGTGAEQETLKLKRGLQGSDQGVLLNNAEIDSVLAGLQGEPKTTRVSIKGKTISVEVQVPKCDKAGKVIKGKHQWVPRLKASIEVRSSGATSLFWENPKGVGVSSHLDKEGNGHTDNKKACPKGSTNEDLLTNFLKYQQQLFETLLNQTT